MGWAVFSPCLLFGLRYSSTGAYKLLGGLKSQCQNGDLQESSHQWVFTDASIVSLPPPWIHRQPLFTQKPLRPTDRSDALDPSAHETLCAPSNNGVSFPWGVCGIPALKPCTQALLVLKATCSRASFSQCQNPYAGEPDLSFRTPTPVRELLWYNYFPVCRFGSPGKYGIWLYGKNASPTISFCLLLWM